MSVPKCPPRLFFIVIVASISLIAARGSAQNAVPMLINYQGELRDPTSGDPVADGSYDMLLRIYDVESGGSALWDGTHTAANGNAVEVIGGVYSVIIGSGPGNALDPSTFDGADRWLEVEVGGETLSPRQRITAVPYSMVSESAQDADTVDGMEGAALEESAEIDADIAAHAGIADAHHARYTDSEAVSAMGAKSDTNPLHHDKTTSFSDLTDAASDAQIPATVARDSEVSSGLSTHAAIADAHHTKTTSFAELTDTANDGQIPVSIARDSEVTSDIAAHAGIADAHHARYTDSEAVSAMGAKSDTNPLHHDKTSSFSDLTDAASDSQIPATIARDSEVNSGISTHAAIADAHHAKTTSFGELTDSASDAQIPATVARGTEVASEISDHAAIAGAHHAKTTSFAELTDTANDAQIPASIARDAEVASEVSTHAALADAHHARYTDSEAVTAMGAKSDTNPLNHEKTTSLPWGSITSIPAGFVDGVDNDSGGDITEVKAGEGLTGGGESGNVALSAAFAGSGSASTVARSDHNHDGGYWGLTGNGGTSPGTHFLGTTDDQPFELRVNNGRVLLLEPNSTCPNLIGGHSGNSITGGVVGATIGGGGEADGPNRVTDNLGTVAGGSYNHAGDGAGTTDDARCATVGGGCANSARRDYTTVGGGYGNLAFAYAATVGGGRGNTASGDYATVAGGYPNTASGDYATVAGGYNIASGDYATVAGGCANTASGNYATVPGGRNNTAAGAYSFAAGRRAKANHLGSFVLADSTNEDFASVRDDALRVRFNGGATFVVNDGYWVRFWRTGTHLIEASNGAYLSTGGVWTNASDRNAKENFAAVEGQEVLARLAEVPIQSWNYKAEDPSIRHMGPMAQNLYAAFGLGDSDKSITTIDADGVALAAIQGLNKLVQEKEDRISTLEGRNCELESRLAALEALVQSLAKERKGGEQ